MSIQHHGDGERSELVEELRRQGALMDRFTDQYEGVAQRSWPNGRTGADDDGDSAWMMATDDKRRVIVIRFPKPMEWIGLDVQSAEELRDSLTERIMALKGITAS
jgi:hypothetical protein